MIFELEFEDKTEWVQAGSVLHCLQSYDSEYEGFQDIKDINEIPDEEAKTIMLTNTEYDENDPEDKEHISLFHFACGDDFCIIGSTEF